VTLEAERASPDQREPFVNETSGFQVASDAPRFYESQVGRFMAPFVDALVSATVRRGDAVLDIACGTGFATRAAGLAAGRGARVEGADVNPGMVAHARSVPGGSGADLRWCEASALDLPYGDGEFDAVICQQGLQFFPDPAGGIREMLRVTRPGGRVGVTVWSPPEGSPYLDLGLKMLVRHGGDDQGEWTTTEPQLRAWFGDAGVHDLAVDLVAVDVDLPGVQSYVPDHLRALPWSAEFFKLSTEQQVSAINQLDEDLAGFRTDDGIRVPFSSYLATFTI
jgi:ubiquinone/menaquinone biosynthesis C-methylase UbiE